MKKLFTFLLVLLTTSIAVAADKEDKILSLSTKGKLGTTEVPVVEIELSVKKRRDLHVALKNLVDPSKNVRKELKPIKKSGKYHFKIDVDGLEPGKYRLDAYMAPRKKDWNDRVGNVERFEFEVVDAPVYEAPKEFSSTDALTKLDFAKEVVGNGEYTLSIAYQITQPRELFIRLLNKDGWKEHGKLKFPLKEPGQISIPFVELADQFPAGDYAWVIQIREPGQEQEMVKRGLHFTLKAE